MADAVQVSAGQRTLAVLTKAKVRYGSLPARKRSWLTGAVVGLVGVGLALVWWAGRPDYRVLFSGLEGKDVAQVSQELGAAGIPFQPTSDGTGVQVPAEMLDKARMEVASKGMPQTGRLGFELFDKPNWVGSEFDERVNYQRALEGELEHTISSLGVVRSARVHLVLPQESMFANEAKMAKASVLLKLKKASLGQEQIDSIRNLVAGAVENLSPEQVTLVDADGRVNLQAKAGLNAGDEEQAMEAKLIAMLEPLAGAGNVRATVSVSYEQGSVEKTDEVYDPSQTAPLSTTKSEQTSGAGGHAQGVPGTASNSPAAAPVGAVAGSAEAAAPGTPPLLEKAPLPVYPQVGGGAQTRKEESGTFAVSKHFSHSEEGPGRVRRVTAAVVVNDRASTDGAGKAEHTVWKPRTAEEMRRLEGLAKAAVGYDEKRGDEVVMENVGFSSNVPETKALGAGEMVEQAKSLLGSQPGALKAGVVGLLGVLLIWLVLRPVAGQVVATLREPALLSSSVTVSGVEQVQSVSAAQETKGLAGDERADWKPEPVLAAPAVKEPLRVRKKTGEAVYEQVAEHIRREPAQSTRLLEAWIGAGEEEA